MRIIYMGTPDFSVPALLDLINSEHDVVGVVTQPDKPKGRGETVQFTPVKEEALKHKIEVFQPSKLRDADSIRWVESKKPDAIVVAAFGQILPREILEAPRYGCFNIHASLLPKYRGASPIQQCILDGESETGITIMQMDEGLDTGDRILVRTIPISGDETGGSLHDKLALVGGPMILEVLDMAENGELRTEPQQGEATYVGMIKKSMGAINFTKSACEIERLIRGLNPWPSAFSYLNGKMIKFWRAEVVHQNDITLSYNKNASNGEIVAVEKDCFYVLTGDGILKMKELQPEGKKRMDAGSYLRGGKVSVGMVFSGNR